jgi:hypothetical protein
VSQSPDFEDIAGGVLYLSCALYDLKQAATAWHKAFVNEMKVTGYQHSPETQQSLYARPEVVLASCTILSMTVLTLALKERLKRLRIANPAFGSSGFGGDT